MKYTLLLFLTVVRASDALPPVKSQYVIGGWIPGDANGFMKKWTPVLQTYLTRTIGPLYDPPISFKLIPVDYTESTLATDRIRAGDQLDFVCKKF